MVSLFMVNSQRQLMASALLFALLGTALLPLVAEAHPPRHARANGHYKHRDYDRGFYRDDDHRWRRNDRPFFSTYGGKVVQGGLVGGGIGAATGVIFNKPVLKSTVIGGAVGAGVQAVRHSNW